ncbi:hypothetical protein PILCRDRAFT_810960 [Piloderma croceum F 1598]|uniref:Uncharacterized protein n=1 Tax=Piloderma croceum (strain F 1598) TaxID=765440 RepID=A0A0C3G625_PILCF|nr:hypothetical protein PILCRDRAFT_810960 [Piloderma croceum F 1598]
MTTEIALTSSSSPAPGPRWRQYRSHRRSSHTIPTTMVYVLRAPNSVDASCPRDCSRQDSRNWKGGIPFGSSHDCGVPNQGFRGGHSDPIVINGGEATDESSLGQAVSRSRSDRDRYQFGHSRCCPES